MLWALWALPVLLWVAVLGGAWHSAANGPALRGLFGAVLGSVPVVLLTVVAGALLAYLGQALLGIGAVIALGMGWFGALLALLVRAWTHRDGWALLISSLVGALLASLLAWQHAVVRGAAPALNEVIAVWVALGLGLLALASYGVWMARACEWSGALAAGALVLLSATTWTGSVLTGAGPDVPVQEVLPETTRPASRPAATRILPQDALLVPLPPVAKPLFSAAGSGHTVYWDPQARTDAHGNLTLAVPLAGLPADVRLSALALSADGAWGTGETELAVQPPLAVEPALPGELTVGDALDVPLVLRNGLPVAQTVQIMVTHAPWFRSVRGPAAQEVVVPAAGAAELSLPIQIREWGAQTFTVTARAGAWSNVITRTVTVRPNAKWVARAYSWWIGDRVSYKFRIPWSAVPDTDRIAVKLSTGHRSVLSEALQWAAVQEGRSFDEVAGAVEARLLTAAYLRRTEQWVGERRDVLERGLAADVQRLLAFERPDGGFSALGAAPADLYRTASALRCLSELAAFTPVDADLLDRTAMWLIRQRTDEGTWQLADPTLVRPDLPVTAHVAWSLVDAGYGSAASTGPAVEYMERYLDQAQDPYVLALVVNALVAGGEPTDALAAGLARLAEQAEVVQGLAWWPSKVQSLSGASGAGMDTDGYRTPSVKVEAAALATYALSRAGVYPERVAQGLAMLVDSRDVYGTWNAPQATALGLRAYLSALGAGDEPSAADLYSTVRVTVDEVAADPAVLSGDMSRVLVFDRLAKGYNDVEIAVDGDEVAYQIVGSYYLPWSQVSSPSPEEEELSIEVSYDRTSVVVGETITATVGVMLNRPGVAPLVSLDLGLPPGLVLETSDLDALVSGGTIARYERVGGRLQVYVRDLSSEQPIRLHYRLHARTPLSVWTQPTYGVDIANPQRPAVRAPVEIEVLRPVSDADE